MSLSLAAPSLSLFGISLTTNIKAAITQCKSNSQDDASGDSGPFIGCAFSFFKILVCTGRERSDGLECWVAMTTEAFARQLLEEAPLTKNGAYVAQSQQYLSELAPRIWEALWGVLQPFSSGEPPLLLALLLLIGAQVSEN